MNPLTLNVDVSIQASGLINGSEIVRSMLRQTLYKVGATAQFAIVRRTPVDLGTARNSIRLNVYMDGDPRAEIGSGLSYMKPLETGRKAGLPPPASALEGWVRRVIKPEEKKVKGIAIAISRRIGAGTSRGTANVGVHMFEKGIREVIPYITQAFNDLETQITRDMNKGVRG